MDGCRCSFLKAVTFTWLCDDEAPWSMTVRLGSRRSSLTNAWYSFRWNADSIHFRVLGRNHVILICRGLDMEESLSSTNWYNADPNEIRVVMSSYWINDVSLLLTYHLIIMTEGDDDILFLPYSVPLWLDQTQQPAAAMLTDFADTPDSQLIFTPGFDQDISKLLGRAWPFPYMPSPRGEWVKECWHSLQWQLWFNVLCNAFLKYKR